MKIPPPVTPIPLKVGDLFTTVFRNEPGLGASIDLNTYKLVKQPANPPLPPDQFLPDSQKKWVSSQIPKHAWVHTGYSKHVFGTNDVVLLVDIVQPIPEHMPGRNLNNRKWGMFLFNEVFTVFSDREIFPVTSTKETK